MTSRARELPGRVQHLRAYRRPDMRGRVTHSDVWAHALARWRPGATVTVVIDPQR